MARAHDHPSGVPVWPWIAGGLLLLIQLGLVEMFDAANDVIRGDLFPPSSRTAVENARQVARFETVHGIFVEPRLYSFAQTAHHVLWITLPSGFILGVANDVYAFFHFAIPVLVAGWVYVRHRSRFAILRNALILCSIIALVGYFAYPVAPPRLTTGLIFGGRPFQFHDTMPYPQNAILINGRPLGFNPYAAMPSLHIAWATICAGTVFLLSRPTAVRILALLYPVVMSLAIVVTANHYILDAVGGVITAVIAAALALALSRRSR